MALGRTITHLFHPQRSNNHRPRFLHPEAFVYLSLVVVGFVALLNGLSSAAGSRNILGFASSITPAQVVEQTNAQRAQAGLPALSLNSKLSTAAFNKGQDMMADQYWAHVAPDGKQPWAFISEAGYSYRVAGENLARDFANTPDMVSAWMASPTHRANIMNPRYSEIGIAVIDGTLQGYETTLVVQMFGTPQVAQAQVPEGGETAGVETQQAPADTVSIVQLPNEAQTEVEAENQSGVEITPATVEESEVLAGALVPGGELNLPPLFTPLQLTKAFFLSMIMVIIGTLVYDSFIIGNRASVRLVGQNLAHVIFFSVIAFLVIFFKGGIVG